MIYQCPNCNILDPNLSPLVLWKGCSVCRFGQKEFSEANYNFYLYKQLMTEALEKIEAQKLIEGINK